MIVDPRQMLSLVITTMIVGIVFVVTIQQLGLSNLIELNIAGSGTGDVRHNTEAGADIVMAQNATAFLYEMTANWNNKDRASDFSNSVVMMGLSEDGGYKNKYMVRSSGANHKVTYEATKISGDFTGDSKFTIILTESGVESFDSIIEMNSQDGDATFIGRVYNYKENRPATLEELDLVGQFMVRHHLNVTEPTPEDNNWLNFCYSLDRDMILDETVPDGLYIAPEGYELNKDGKLVRIKKSDTNETENI